MKCKKCGNNSFEERYGGIADVYLVCMKCEEILLLKEEHQITSEGGRSLIDGDMVLDASVCGGENNQSREENAPLSIERKRHEDSGLLLSQN